MSARRTRERIAELREAIGEIGRLITAYECVTSDMPESEVVAHVMIATRLIELHILLGTANLELSRAKHELAAMPKRMEAA